MCNVLSSGIGNHTGLRGLFFRWFIILILVDLIFLGKFSCFVIEPTDADGEQYLPEIFAFGKFSFPETKAVVLNDPHSIFEVMRACAGDDNAKYAMEKLSSVLGSTLKETALITPKITAAEDLSHVFNGCTPGLSSALKEIITHVSLALWPWNIYAIKNYAYQLEWYGKISIANNLYDDCIHLLEDERGCALHRMFVAPPLLWNEQQAHRIYIEAILKTKKILLKDNKRNIPRDIPRGNFPEDVPQNNLQNAVITDLTLDPQYNVRELQMHSQYLGKHPGLLSQAYALTVCHLYPSLGVSMVSPFDPRNSRWKDGKTVEKLGTVTVENAGEMIVEKVEKITGENVVEETSKIEEESNTNRLENNVNKEEENVNEQEISAIDDEKNVNKGINRGLNRESRGTRTIRLGVISEHEGNSSPGICLMKVLQLLVASHGNDVANADDNDKDDGSSTDNEHGDRSGNRDDRNDGKNRDEDGNRNENGHSGNNNNSLTDNVKIELILFDRPTARSIFSYLLTQVASKVITISHLDLLGSRQLIADEKVDVLLYMALPTEKFTTFLSMSRLAPVQVQFGIGHPVSSGSLAIDYSVVSELMIPEYRDLTRYEEDLTFINTANRDLSQYEGNRRTPSEKSDRYTEDKTDGQTTSEELDRETQSQDHPSPSPTAYPASSAYPLHYTEQLILFSSLGHYLVDPLLLYPPEGLDTSSFTTSFSASKSSLYSSGVSSALSSTLSSTLSSDSVSPVEVEVNSNGEGRLEHNVEEKEGNAAVNDVGNEEGKEAMNKLENVDDNEMENEVQIEVSNMFFHPVDFAFNSSCRSINMFLSRIGMDQVTAEMLGDCYVDEGVEVEGLDDDNLIGDNRNISNIDSYKSDGNNGIGGSDSDNNDGNQKSSIDNETPTARTIMSRTYIPRGLHLYGCMQMPKKMHPSFDPVLKGILTQDPGGIVLMLARGEDLIPRWAGTVIDNKAFPGSLNMTEKQIKSRMIFIPRLSHPDYLKLTSLVSVFLNTFPYGAGITSSEALALCVPVVTLPSKITVLQMTLAQVRTYGHDIADQLIAKNVPDYIEKVIQITMGRNIIKNSSYKDNSKNQFLDSEKTQKMENTEEADEIKEMEESKGGDLERDSDSVRGPPLAHDMRRTLCDTVRRAGLFGHHQLQLAVEEWRAFLINIT